MSHHEHRRSSEEIAREIEERRARMDHTVDELEARLAPRQLMNDALGALRGGSNGHGHSAAHGAKEFVKDHPVPLSLLAAGAAWLAAEAASGHSVSVGDDDYDTGTYGRAEGRVGPYRGDEIDDAEFGGRGGYAAGTASTGYAASGSYDGEDRSMGDRASDAKDAIGDKASSAKSSVKGAASSAKESMGDAASTAKHKAESAADSARHAASRAGDRVSDAASTAGRRTKQGARKAQRGFMHAMEDNPLAVAAAAFGLGMAGGLSAPSTDWEDEHVGHKSQALKDQAKRVAQDTGESAKRVAQDAAAAAKDEAESSHIGDSMKQSAERVASSARETAGEARQEAKSVAREVKDVAKSAAHEAKETARERARQEDLTKEGMKAQAREAKDDVKRA